MKKRHIFGLVTLLFLLVIVILLLIKFLPTKEIEETPTISYIASNTYDAVLYDSEYNEALKLIRGSKIYVYSKDIVNDENTYKKVKYNNNEYLISVNNIVDKDIPRIIANVCS